MQDPTTEVETNTNIDNEIEVEDITCFDHVPKSLENWFIVHAILDILVAIPLFIIPRIFLETLGWMEVDTLAARLVAAALLGIGSISFFSRNEQVDTYRSLVRFKLIWSIIAELGIALSLIIDAENYPSIAWIFVVIFVSFTVLWGYWWNALRSYE